MCFAPQRRPLFRHRNFQRWSEHGVFCTFWLGNVLRAKTACTFSTSQLPKVFRTCQFLTLFDLEMCLAPQGRARFHISTSKSGLRTVFFLYILTWKCASRHNGAHFFDISTSKSAWNLCVLCILTWICASRQNGVQLFVSHLASWLRTRRFGEVTFRPSRATNHWKNTVNRDFPTFSRTCIFFLLTLSLLGSSPFLASPLWLFPPLLFHLSILSEVWLLNFLGLIISKFTSSTAQGGGGSFRIGFL